MAVLRMVVIVRSVEVGRHDRNVIRAILLVQKFTIFQTADLGERICLVRLLQLSGQKAVLLHRLRSHTRIDAGGTKEHQLLAAVLPCLMNHIHLQCHIVIHKICQRFAVRHDTADFCRCEEYILRLLLSEEFFHILLTAEI